MVARLSVGQHACSCFPVRLADRILKNASAWCRAGAEPQKLEYQRPTEPVFHAITSSSSTASFARTIKFREGNTGRSYSSRYVLYTYICMRLKEGVDIYQSDKNGRTSIEMIEKLCAAPGGSRLCALRAIADAQRAHDPSDLSGLRPAIPLRKLYSIERTDIREGYNAGNRAS
jgi:hypothetical protein